MPSSRAAAGKAAHDSRSEAPGLDQRFPRSHRLTARRQFVEVYNRGWKARRSSFMLFGVPNDVGWCRLGLTVTKRAGTAVARNRIKRVLREVFRRHHERFPVPLDVVVNAYRSVLEMSADRLEREFLGAMAELARKARK